LKPVSEIIDTIGRIPYMTPDQAEAMPQFIVDNRLSKVLELGIFHGASTCYIANAVSDREDGAVVSVDRAKSRLLEPNVEQLLEKLGLRDRVTVHFEPNSYIWRLMKLLEEHEEPVFDLCYLDGAHNWFVDGFAFFLVDRLLKPGGWLIMDDLNWRYLDSPAYKGSETLANMDKEEAECRQLRKVWELLVQRQPGYGNFREENNWAFAQKIADFQSGAPRVETKIVVEERQVGLGAAMIKLGRRLGL
jgi:predicted O-methyltransferase YrrM